MKESTKRPSSEQLRLMLRLRLNRRRSAKPGRHPARSLPVPARLAREHDPVLEHAAGET